MNLTKILMYSVLLLELLTLYLNFFSEMVIRILYAFVSHRHSRIPQILKTQNYVINDLLLY